MSHGDAHSHAGLCWGTLRVQRRAGRGAPNERGQRRVHAGDHHFSRVRMASPGGSMALWGKGLRCTAVPPGAGMRGGLIEVVSGLFLGARERVPASVSR